MGLYKNQEKLEEKMKDKESYNKFIPKLYNEELLKKLCVFLGRN